MWVRWDVFGEVGFNLGMVKPSSWSDLFSSTLNSSFRERGLFWFSTDFKFSGTLLLSSLLLATPLARAVLITLSSCNELIMLFLGLEF